MKILQLAIISLTLFQISGCSQQSDSIDDTRNNINQTTAVSVPDNESAEEERSPLLLSSDFGQTWIDASYGLPREIQVSFMEAKENEMVIATDNMGVFVSSNYRTRWKRVGTNLPDQKINALHVVDNTIYVGVYQHGIFKSDDEGMTWISLNNNLPNLNVQTIWRFEDELFVGTDAGIFKQSNIQNSWQPTTITTQIMSIYEYDEVLVAGTSQGTVISEDKGSSWNWIRKKGAVHYTHNIGKRVVELALFGDLTYSDDWGQHWSEMEYKPRSGSYVYEIVKVGDYLILSNNYGVHRSKDNGQTWEHIFKTESMGFFDFLVVDGVIYGGTRAWDEYRKRNK